MENLKIAHVLVYFGEQHEVVCGFPVNRNSGTQPAVRDLSSFRNRDVSSLIENNAYTIAFCNF